MTLGYLNKYLATEESAPATRGYSNKVSGVYTATAAESGTTFYNFGATGTVIIDLPTAEVGLEFAIYRVNVANSIRLRRTGSDSIYFKTNASATQALCSSVGAYLRVRCFGSGEWVVTDLTETVA